VAIRFSIYAVGGRLEIVGLQQFIVGIRAYEIKNRYDDSYDTKIEFL
jgi:hypothetical protein